MSPGDERFSQTMADLSSRLRDRMAQQPRIDPITALKNRQAALKAFDRDRRQKLYVIAGGLGCVVAAGAIAWGIVMFAQADQLATSNPGETATIASVTPSAAAPSSLPVATSSPPPAKLAAATPPAEAQAPPAPVQTLPPAPVQTLPPAPLHTAPPIAPATVEATTMPTPDPAPVRTDTAPAGKPVEQAAAPDRVPTPSNASPADRPPTPPLSRPEIAEAQQLLGEFGFNPGPIDGSAGPRTIDAVSRYQQRRGLAQTGVLDSGLLQQLRQDPAPKTVMVAQQPPPSAYTPRRYAQTQSRTPAVFRPVEMAGQQITAWLNSVFR